MLGSIIAGGLSLVGGLFARDAAKKTQKMQIKAHILAQKFNKALGRQILRAPIDTKTFLRQSDRLGINPITMIRNGALSIYGVPRQFAYSLIAENAPPISHVPSVGEAVIGGLSAAFNHWNTEQNRLQAQEFQREMFDRNVAAQQFLRNSGPGGSFYVPSMVTSGSLTSSRGNAGLSGVTGLPYPSKWEVGDVTNTNPFQTLPIDRKMADGGVYEQRWGELGGSAAGLWVMLGDGYHNVSGGRHLNDDIWMMGTHLWNTVKNPNPTQSPGEAWRSGVESGNARWEAFKTQIYGAFGTPPLVGGMW